MTSKQKIIEEKSCSHCKITKPIGEFWENKKSKDGFASWCKVCTRKSYKYKERKEYSRNFYKNNKEKASGWIKRWRNENREKVNAKGKLYRAVKAGKVEKKPCAFCGDVKVDGHHFDYDKPFEVLWLCRRHHRFIHSCLDTIREKTLEEERQRIISQLNRLPAFKKSTQDLIRALNMVITKNQP